ncbi:MAG: IS110 family transposase [Acidimicrobiia bacterium]
MRIVGGLDVHRAQITFDYVDLDTGDVETGRIEPATRVEFREWLTRFNGVEAVFATEGCTGWRFVVEELQRAGIEAHLAEPADTASLRGRKKRAKTDRGDARHLRQLLIEDRLPESWIAPAHVLEIRTKGRLYIALMNQRRMWQQRIQAVLFHEGVEKRSGLLTIKGRRRLEGIELSDIGRQYVNTALRVIDITGIEADMVRNELTLFASSHPACRALTKNLYGVGELTAAIIWAEMGDTRRFSSSKQAVRHTGLDITVWSSDTKRPPGHLARQGPPALRWALFEAALASTKKTSPDHDYYLEVTDRLGAKRAFLSVSRKLARKVHHILRELGDTAYDQAA